MDRRTKICIWIILLGLGNFFLYAIVYVHIGGEAVTGRVDPQGVYHLHPESRPGGVPFWVFLYSGLHSISIWPTVGATWLAMLTLAKDRIISSMRSSVVRGRTFFTILATLIAFTTAVMTVWFSLQFAARLSRPAGDNPPALTESNAPARAPGLAWPHAR